MRLNSGSNLSVSPAKVNLPNADPENTLDPRGGSGERDLKPQGEDSFQ